jgi:hypothetical protein
MRSLACRRGVDQPEPARAPSPIGRQVYQSVAPCGFTSGGLPVGVQIVGPQYADRTCIHFARLLEREFQAFVPPPGYD